jgi:hypothetical protein
MSRGRGFHTSRVSILGMLSQWQPTSALWRQSQDFQKNMASRCGTSGSPLRGRFEKNMDG